jgi:hypothetical protein
MARAELGVSVVVLDRFLYAGIHAACGRPRGRGRKPGRSKAVLLINGNVVDCVELVDVPDEAPS